MENEKVKHFVFRIQQDVLSSIFEAPAIQSRVSSLFSDFENKIDDRIKEITDFITSFLDIESCYELSHDFIFELFKKFFQQHIANKAVRIAFINQNYNIYDNILSLLTNGQMQAAIYGKILLNTFSKALRLMQKKQLLDHLVRNNLQISLKQTFLSQKKQKNGCGECNCTCRCDVGCNGDWQKCTSPVGCNHHCGCYISAMIANWPDSDRTIECHSKSNKNNN